MQKEKQGSRGDRGNRSNQHSDFPDVPENLWRARIVPTNDFEYCAPDEELKLERGDFVVLRTRYGKDMARILGPASNDGDVEADDVRLIQRMATDEDLARREEYEVKEVEAYRVCRLKIKELGLAMKLVSAHYMLDEQKAMFFFTAENRIDFRELVKDLVAHFKMRIELRQIGVRDESRVVGGIAVCGRQYCCHGLTDKLSPVSIKMAKDQNLSLNSLKISGPCGRLLCCLSFEHEHYSKERKNLPREGGRINHDDVSWKVSEVNIFTRKVHLTAAEGRRMEVSADNLTRKEGGGWQILQKTEEVDPQTEVVDPQTEVVDPQTEVVDSQAEEVDSQAE